MKRSIIFCVLWVALLTAVYPEVVATFPDMAKPLELRMDNGYVFISDQSSVFVYDEITYKLVRKLGKKGEGPEEFKTNVRIAFTADKLFVYDSKKVVVYSKDFKFVREMRLLAFSNRITPIGDNFVLEGTKALDGKKFYVFSLYNEKLEKIKDIVSIPEAPDQAKYFINPWPKCRSLGDKVFIAQPHKGFYIDVFDKNGEKLYQIEKEIKPVKAGDVHRKSYMEEIKYFVGRRLYERGKARGAFDRPLREFVPPITNIWVSGDRLYVKTYDITDTKEKYIILDMKGNILQPVFLPKAYLEIFTFNKNKFYYLMDSEDDDGWVLHAVQLEK